MKKTALLLFCLQVPHMSMSLTLNRVILSTDNNPLYIEFWPIVAHVWKYYIGITPTLALIAGEDVKVDESIGEVIRFTPIPGVANALYAQAVRLLLPAYFEHDGCIISDIDMLPLHKGYFIDSIISVPDNHFVVYRDKALPMTSKEYPMCYIAAKGKTFKEIFNIETLQDIPSIIQTWAQLNLGWSTDQKVLYKYIQQWPFFTSRCTLLHHVIPPRIDRSNWKYNPSVLATGKYYIDAHCPRPYSAHKQAIDQVAKILLAREPIS